MKKILTAFILTASAVTATSAKEAGELRIYINPGHGGWTADDRPCQLVNHPAAFSRTNTDTLSFFESNTDLEKGFGLLERLIDYGLTFDRDRNLTGREPGVGAARDLEQNIVMSRVKNGPYLDDNATASQYGSGKVPEEYYWYNRNLTDICEEVQVNDFDMFISIHSNAGAGLYSNYPLYLYRGYDDCREASGNTAALQTMSRRMAEACWDHGYENPHSYWSHFKTSKYVKGDLDFYGDDGVWSTRSDGTRVYGYLGALRHSVPGFLVEGYFHSYEPARHRAMNWDVCRAEGIAYAHGIADYFGLEKENFGTIYGIVRDANETFTHTHYHPAADSDDTLMPLNGATVVLKRDDEERARYVTDGYYNGAFVFDRLDPGLYTLTVSRDGYLSTSQTVEVKAATFSYPKVYISKLPAYRKAGFAYGLKAATGHSGNILNYSLTADVERAEIVISPDTETALSATPESAVETFEVETTAGTHTFELPMPISGAYRWGVRITPFANSEAGEIFSDASGLAGCRGGVVPLTDPDYETFGYMVVAHGKNNGIDVYDPAGEKISSRIWKGHGLWGPSPSDNAYDPCRGQERQGKAVLASWGDNACGLVTVDPMGYEEPQGMYAGTRQTAGHYLYNGVNVGGGISGFCFVGEGDATRLYTFSEDHEGLNGSGKTENSVVCYRIGNARMIETAPEVIGHKELLANTNVEMAACGNGFFAAQVRAAGMNTPQNPGFVYIEGEDHTVTYNSGISMPSLNSCTSGIAVTGDGKTLAVSDASSINIYDVAWNGSTPFITLKYSIPTGATQAWMHMRFDAAGNLHTYQTSNGGYRVYALRNDGTPVLYEAPEAIVTGIECIKDIEEISEGEQVYYDLSGRRIRSDRPAPGIYLDSKGRKVVVKR